MTPKVMPEILSYFLEDLLQEEPGYRVKSMFSGYGIFYFGKIFAILVDEEFYFKVGENNIKDYQEYHSSPFTYEVKGKMHQMNYYKLPEHVLENAQELKVWIQKSLQVPEKTKPSTKKDISQKVLTFLLEIPKGKVTTYKLLAQRFGVHPRTIASIMKYNKEPYVYPCYKVVASDGKISGYNTPRGVEEKIEKLLKDGIEIKNGAIDKKYFYINNLTK